MKNNKMIFIFLTVFLQLSMLGNDKEIAAGMTKIVIPAAGLGTRFLPASKSVAKALLPLLNKPAIQIIVEECLNSGFNNLCLIVNDSNNNKAIKDFLTRDETLENNLSKVGKLHFLNDIHTITDQATFSYINHSEMRGLGDAILVAQAYIGLEYFGVMLPDIIVFETDPIIHQMAQLSLQHNASIIAVKKVASDETHNYGIIKIGSTINENLFEIEDIVEKPKTATSTPSRYAMIGRYVLSPSIFNALEKTAPDPQGELQLTDAIVRLIKSGHKVLALKIDGKLFDIGQPPGWLAANIYLGERSAEYGAQIKKYKGGI